MAMADSILTAIASLAEMLKALAQQSAIPPLTPCHSPQWDYLCGAFRLSSFEQLILLLTMGMELEPTWASLCAQAQRDPHKQFPTFQLAIALSSNPDWSCLAPSAPLRYWKLIELGASNSLTASPLRIDERILHYLLGVPYLDERLMGILQPVQADPILAVSHLQIAAELPLIQGTLNYTEQIVHCIQYETCIISSLVRKNSDIISSVSSRSLSRPQWLPRKEERSQALWIIYLKLCGIPPSCPVMGRMQSLLS